MDADQLSSSGPWQLPFSGVEGEAILVSELLQQHVATKAVGCDGPTWTCTDHRSHTRHTKIFLSINESACGWDARAAFHPVTSLFVKAPAQNVRHAAKVVKDATRCNPQGLWSKPQMGAQAMIEIL